MINLNGDEMKVEQEIKFAIYCISSNLLTIPILCKVPIRYIIYLEEGDAQTFFQDSKITKMSSIPMPVIIRNK